MDICLNISTTPAPAGASKARKNKSNFFKPQVKRQVKKANAADKATAPKTQSSDSPQKATARIKQKSLAAIVANNIARSKAESFHNVPKTAHNSQKATNETPQEKTTDKNKQRSSLAKIVDDNKPLMSFTKSTVKNIPKIIVAKTRVVDDSKPKKSLSDIFSKGSVPDITETKLFPTNPDTKTEEITKTQLPKFPHARNVIVNNDDRHSQYPRKDNRRNKPGFSKIEDNKDKVQYNKEKPRHNKPTGKISSLFGNNPEVPNIGQRLVKPVNEVVFSKTAFSDLGLHAYTVSNLEQNMNITNMTTVQQKAIPVILSGRNVLIRSQTGSGKTLAYALPIVERLQKIRPKLMRNSGLKALIVVPTRELALQTYECFLKLVKPFSWIVSGYLVGGEKRKAEKARLRRGCTILVATPGRLLDHIKHTEALKLCDVKCFVLDEADRMLDMGYEKDIAGIVDALKESNLGDQTGSSYDPLQLIRGIGKKVIDEKEGQPEVDGKKAAEEEEEKEDDNKPEYHSGTDSDSEEQQFPIRMKKTKKDSRETVKEKVAEVSVDQVKRTDVERTEMGDPESTEDSSKQTILLSATLTAAVEKLAGITMTNPVLVDAAQENLTKVGGNLSDMNEDLVVPQGVVQSYIVTPPKLRMVTLSGYIAGKCQTAGQHKILVFMATQDMIDYHADILAKVLGKPREDEDDEDAEPLVDVEFFKLHGSMSQKERTEVFKTFRKARSGVLLCTDVAARGLDMPQVDTVVQYTGPLSARDYVHRIGRTARAGTSGVSTIFLTPPEIDFIRMLESRRIRIKQEDMNDVLDKLVGPFSKHNSVQATAIALQNEFETLVLNNKQFHSKACKAYVSWIRFYSSYPRDMREVFNRKDLHLGHYAKSFALRDPPQKIGGIGKTLRDNETSQPQHNNRLSNERLARQPQRKQDSVPAGQKPGLLKRSRMLNTSEYGSGLEPIKKSKKS